MKSQMARAPALQRRSDGFDHARILSIDLPWSAEGTYGFAFTDVDGPERSIFMVEISMDPFGLDGVLGDFERRHGRFDVVLLDHPIGDTRLPPKTYRPVELAFTNSTFAGAKRIQCPRFQPGGFHTAVGLGLASEVARRLCTERGIVVECFPQLSLPSLLAFAEWKGMATGGVRSLKSHKAGAEVVRAAAQQEVLGALGSWTGRKLSGPSRIPRGDCVDAAMALLPALETLAPSPLGGIPEPWNEVVWLHEVPPGDPPLPKRVPRAARAAVRARWMSPVQRGVVGAPGLRLDGILSMRLPGWPSPALPPRLL